MKKSYLFLADGFEEIEALATVDIMRRAEMDVVTVSVMDSHKVTGAHGVAVCADILFDEIPSEEAEWLILPGGMPGAQNLYDYEPLRVMLCTHAKNGGKVAAICAAPAVVLAPLGLLSGKEATCYPGFQNACVANGAIMRDVPVMESPALITGNGPSAAMRFALAIVQNSCGEAVAQSVGSGMLYYPKSLNFYF